jgi:hypothetical protein
LAAIPITPGGLGITETGVIGVLTAVHVPLDTAVLAVIGWRFFNFWLPIPVGAVAYMTLRVARGASLHERRTALSSMTDIARSQPAPDITQNPGPEPRSRRPDTGPTAGPAVPPVG